VKIIHHNVDLAIGYGQTGKVLFDSLRGLGFSLELSTDMLSPADVAFICPQHFVQAPIVCGIWEASEIPKFDSLKRAKVIFSISDFNTQALRVAGFKQRIIKIRHGVDYNFAFLPQGPFTFISVGADSGQKTRKRMQDLIECFIKAFPRDPDVRLIIKQNDNCFSLHSFDSRISVVRGKLSRKEMEALYHSAHCGIFLSGLEGFGIPPLELMRTGRPVLLPFYGGYMEYMRPDCGWAIPYKEKPAPKFLYRGVGKFADVSLSAVVELMREVRNDPTEIARRGLAAYYRASEFTHDLAVQTLMKDLKNARAF